jgi:hypothetical protein
VQRCLVDGLRSRHARSLSPSGIADAAHVIAVGLLDRGWTKWSARISDSLGRAGNDAVDAEQLGEALETLRRFGPQRRAFGELAGDDPLEVLVASLGRYWPSHR